MMTGIRERCDCCGEFKRECTLYLLNGICEPEHPFADSVAVCKKCFDRFEKDPVKCREWLDEKMANGTHRMTGQKIFVDEIREYPSGKWCHMWTGGDTDTLDTFAQQLGLNTNHVHISSGISGKFYHYDLRPSKRQKAIKLGAIEKPLREWIAERGLEYLKPNVPDEDCPKRSCPILHASNYVVCTQCGKNPIPKQNRF